MAFYARLDKSVSFSLRPATTEDLAPYARDVAAQQRRLADRYRTTIQRMQQTPMHQQLVGGHTKNVDVAWTAAAAAATAVVAETAMHIDVCETVANGDELVTLDALQLCQMHGVNYMGDHFVFLMSHSISSKTDSYVAHTRNPLRDVYLHNTRRLPDRNTCVAAPYWELDCVLGPFNSVAVAKDCGRMLVHGTRGKVPKRKKSPFLSQGFNVPLFDKSQRFKHSFPHYLAQNALPIYSEVLRTGL